MLWLNKANCIGLKYSLKYIKVGIPAFALARANHIVAVLNKTSEKS